MRSNFRALASLLVLLNSAYALMLTPSATGQSLPVQTTVLPNGHHIHVVEKRDQPIVTLDTWVKVGSQKETPDNNGVTHFLEHLIFKGTRRHKAGEADAIIESKGAVFNAATSNDYTHYYITLPSSFFDQALQLHADMLLNAVVPKDELDRERPVVQEEINRATDNPQRQLFTQFMKQLFPGHGYSRDTLGPKSNIANIPREKILGYYQNWYQPSRFHTVIVGDVNPKQAVEAVKHAFSQKDPRPVLKPGTYSPPKPMAVTPVKQANAAVSGLDTINTLYWTVGWQAPKAAKLEDVVGLDAAMFALGGGGNSRLYKRLVEQQPLVSSLAAYNMTLKEAGALQVYAEMKPEEWKTVSTIVKDELHQLLQNGITQEELDAFKVQTLTEKKFNQESTDGLAQNIGYFATTSKLSDMDRYIEAVQNLSLAEVRKAVQKYLVLDKASSSAIAPKALVETVKTEQTQWVKGLPSPDTPVRSSAGSSASPVSQVKTVTLPNDTRLILNALPGAQTTTLKLFAKGGRLVEGKPGLASIAASLLTKGTESRTAADINEAMQANGISLSASAKDDVVEVSGSATAEQWGNLQSLLLDVFQHNRITQAELNKAKTRVKQGIEASRDDLSTRASETFYQSLYPNHPYGAIGQRVLDSLDSISLEDVQQYLAQTFQPQNLVVVLSGKLPKQPEKVVSQLVSQRPYQQLAQADKIPEPAILQTPQTGMHEVTLPKIAAARMIKGYQAPPIGSEDYAAAKVLAAVLGNGLSSRLFTNLRKEQSLAYEIYAAVQPGLEASTFMMVGGTDPKNQQALQKGFETELKALADKPLTHQELKAVKDKLVGQFALAHETPAEQAYYLGYYEALGLGHQFDKKYPQLIQAVKAEQVQAMARRLLEQKPTWAIVKPEGKNTASQSMEKQAS